MSHTQFYDKSLSLVVVITSTNWHEPPRIRHQVTRQLTRFYNVLYIEKNLKNRNDHIEQINERQIVYSPGMAFNIPLRLNANEPLTHHLVNIHFKRKIIAFAKQFNPVQMFLVNFVYDFFEVMRSDVFAYKIYFCFDEFPKMRRRKKKRNFLKNYYQKNLFQLYENKVAHYSDICLTTHIPLKDKLKNICLTKMFYPGHEFSNGIIQQINIRKGEKKYPIKLGFMGYITYNLLFDWINEISNNPDFELYMIGPLHKINENDIPNYKNITFTGPLYKEKLYKMLTSFNVLLMPYNPEIPEVNIQTVSNKFFQYVATGKPIVISNMEHYINLPYGIYYKADSKNDFINKIYQAYEEDCKEYVNLRLKIAAENTWDKRGNELHDYIESSLNRRGKK